MLFLRRAMQTLADEPLHSVWLSGLPAPGAQPPAWVADAATLSKEIRRSADWRNGRRKTPL